MRHRSWMNLVVVFGLLVGAVSVMPASGPAPVRADPGVLHVKPGATGSGDCSTWANACELQHALSIAGTGDKIWVMAGTYKPGSDRIATFQLKSGVEVYGGFAGTETSLGERDWEANETILSGDIGTPGSVGDNSYHVVTGSGTDASAVLNGFTVSGGNANGADYWDAYGGGMYNDGGSPTLANLIFNGNTAGFGGGMMNDRFSNPTLTNCTFSDNSAITSGGMANLNYSSPTLSGVIFSGNTASLGGGMSNSHSSPTLTDCIFSGNSAAQGGGMVNEDNSSPVLEDCTFSGNTATNYGGGMHNRSSSPELTNVTFGGNTAHLGGGMYNTDNSTPELTDVDFSGNTADGNGGGMYNGGSSGPTLTNCTFDGNTADGGGGGMYNWQSSPWGRYVTFSGNTADFGGGMYNNNSSPTLWDSTLSGNTATTNGGGMYNYDSSPKVAWTDFYTNTANYGGGVYFEGSTNGWVMVTDFSGNTANYGGGMYNNNSSPELKWDSFRGNTANYGGGMYNNNSSPALTESGFYANSADSGGGMYNNNSSPTLSDATLSGNTADFGGGMYNGSSSPTLSDCTFSGNTAGNSGGGIYSVFGSPVLTGTRFLGNTAALIGGGMYNHSCNPTLTHCIFSGNSADYGGGMHSSLADTLKLTNCTLSGNSADRDGGGMWNYDSTPAIQNSILWANIASTGPQIWNGDVSTPTIRYSDIQGSGGSGLDWDSSLGSDGGGNIDADPLFVDANGADDIPGTTDDDLRLICTSPAIDGGDNSAVPPGVTTDLDGNPRVSGIPAHPDYPGHPRVDMGPYEEQDYGQWVSEGYINLVEGRAYRTGFHDVATNKTIPETIDAYEVSPFAQAAILYSLGLLCAPTAERRGAAGTGLLDANWELATGEMLVGNEAMVQAMDMRFTTQYPGLEHQIDKLWEARNHFGWGTGAYLEVLPGDLYTVAMELQPSRLSYLDVENPEPSPYLDVQRLAEAAAKKSRATVEIAERQFRLYTPAGKAAAEDTLRLGFDEAVVELALLDDLAEGWATPTAAYLNAYQGLTQDIADMQRLFGYLKEGKNPFGYAEQYVPFMPIELGVEFPDPNFVRWYDRAMTDDWVGYEKAKQEYDELMTWQRTLDDNETALGEAMGLLDGKYRERLVEICGPDGTEPDLAGCHRNEAGTMDDQFYAIQQAEIRVQKVRLQMENQLGLIRIEQQRAAEVAGIHRATAVMYTETGEELASLARQEVELDQAGGWCDMFGGMFERAWSGASTGMAFGPYGAIIGGAVGWLLECGSIIEAEATSPEMDLADIEERREEIKAYQQAQVEYAEAEIEDANSEALIKQYMLEYAELKLDLAIAINQLQQELARLEGMRTEVEYLLARWNEARRTVTELYTDPGARVVRDMYAEEARHYFEAALESAHLAGRALDYEMAELWPDQNDVYGFVVPEGTGDLEGHLGDMRKTYDDWFWTPQPRDTAMKLSEAMGFVDSWEMVGGVPVWVTAEEKFNRYVSDPSNWVDRDNDGTPESLELVFQTTLFADPPQFFSNNVYNDKIRFFYIVLWGDENALDPDDNDTYVMLRQEGTSFIRDEDARPLARKDSFREYNLEPSRNYAPKAIYNRKPDFEGDESCRSHGLYWRSVACTKWVLTIDREGDPANDDLDLAALDEIEVHISQRNFPLPALRAAEGEAGGSSPEEGSSTQAPDDGSASDAAGREAARFSLPALTADADAVRRFAGTVSPEQPQRLPPLELALLLEETGGSVTGAIEAEGLLGYPVLDAQTGLGPVLHGTVQDGKYLLTSDLFYGSGGGMSGYRMQVVLTTTVATSSTISGEYVEKIRDVVPHDLEVRGVYTLTRTLEEPLAGFSAKPSTGPAPLVVDFLDFSLGDPTSWAWDFGDGATSAEQHPTHTYEQPGLYAVTLTVSNLFGSHTLMETDYISVTQPAAPLAIFEATPRLGVAPLPVDFKDRSPGGPTSWAWDLGDGATSTDQYPSHIYYEPGSYTVTLTVSNEFGSHTRTEPDYILVNEAMAPEADFSGDPTSGLAPLTVTFSDESTNDPTAWAWDFGDGGTSTEQHPEYTYTSAGTFTVTLTVSNAVGSDTTIMASYISVTEPAAPEAHFSASPTSGFVPLAVTFTDESTNAPTAWAWNFGDGLGSGEKNPLHTYLSSGSYTVTLTAYNAHGSNTLTRPDFITVMEREKVYLPLVMRSMSTR